MTSLSNFLSPLPWPAWLVPCGAQENERDPTTIVQDVGALMRRMRGRFFGPYWRYDRLLKHLYSLGADDFKVAQVSQWPSLPALQSPLTSKW